MILLVAWLFIETYRVVARERRAQGGFVTHTLHKERSTYAVISTFFALSYVVRYIFNEYGISCEADPWSMYALFMSEIVCYLFEGVSMGVLMYFHMTNFK